MRSHRIRALALVALGLFAIGASAACSGGDDSPGTCSTSGTASLVVNVVGLPAGVNAKVKVTGPSGTQSLTGSQTFAGTAAGSYSVTADKVTAPDPIVRTVYSATISQSTVCVNGTTTVTVTYAPVPTSNKIWIATSNAPSGNAVGIASAGLGATGSPAATSALETPIGRHIAFDRDGNLWANGGTTADPTLVRMGAASLAATSGKVLPDRKINVAGLDCGPGVGGIAFDKDGALWFASPCKKSIYKLSTAQLATDGTVTPALTIAFTAEAQGLAFDKAGNLWVGTGDDLERLDAATLGSASATPSLKLTVTSKSPGGSPLHPGFLAFDASGNLWSNDFGGNVVFQFPAAELAGTTNKEIVPPALVTLQVGALLGGMSFDEGGGLWIAYSAGKFIRLFGAQLTTTTDAGNPTVPDRIISSPQVAYTEDIAFYPAAAALPLASALP